jgi:hypothetical protein
MKKAISLLGIVFSLSCFANQEPDITIEAKRAEGRNHYKEVDAQSCFFSAVVRDYGNGDKVLKIFLNSFNPRSNDEVETDGPNFSISLDLNNFPLKNGVVKKYQEGLITYENGILKKSLSSPSAQYFGLAKDIETIEIAVDPKLQKVKWARAEKYVKRNLLPNVKQESLKCEF